MRSATDFIYRDGMRRRDRWLAQPGPIVHKSVGEKINELLLGALLLGTLATAMAFGVMILQGI